MSGARPRTLLALTALLAVSLILLRLLHLGADTPYWLSGSEGEFVDEGYKTLDARNLVLFGTVYWSPLDRYEGWISESPLVVWPYYASFRLFGTDLEAARYVTVLYLALFLAGFVLAQRRRYGGFLLLGGVALLGLESTLFFFSRIAVFEFPIIALFYGLLFLFAAMSTSRPVLPLALAVGMSVLLVFGIKLSALLYLAPVFLASAAFLVLQKGPRRPRVLALYAVASVVALGIFLFLTRAEWRPLLALAPGTVARSILDNPLVHRSPVPVLAGLLCAFHLVVCRPDLCLGNLYRLNLVAVALLGIPLVAAFEYDPLRYYVPLLPAYLLVVLEWIHLRGWTFLAPRSWLAGLATLTFLVPWLYYLIGLPLKYETAFSGDAPSLSEIVLVVVVAAVIWACRSMTLRGIAVASALSTLLAVFLVYDAVLVGSFLWRPSYESQQVRTGLLKLLPEDSVLGGVWAPFFVLGTPFKTLYIAGQANSNSRLPDLAPDYVVLTAGTDNSRVMMMRIQSTPGMRVGDRLYGSSYRDKESTLHPLFFDLGSKTSDRRGPRGIGRALMRVGDVAAAEQPLRNALQELETNRAANPVWVAEARSDWGECLMRLGRYAEAEPALLAAYEVFRPGGEAPAQVTARITLRRLIRLYRAWNEPEQAEQYESLLAATRPEPSGIGPTEVWTFDDLRSIGAHVTTELGAPRRFDTVLGAAVELGGEGDGVVVDAHPLEGATEFTAEVIFRPLAGGSEAQPLLDLRESGSGDFVSFEIRRTRTGRWYLGTEIESGKRSNALYAWTYEHPLDTWHHAAIVVGDGQMRQYVNGVPELTRPIELSPPRAGRTWIGARADAGGFKGALRQVRFTPRALAPDEFLSADDPAVRRPSTASRE